MPVYLFRRDLIKEIGGKTRPFGSTHHERIRRRHATEPFYHCQRERKRWIVGVIKVTKASRVGWGKVGHVG